MTRIALLSATALLAACAAQTPPVDTARINPAAAWIVGDPDVWALNQAQWAFADNGRTLNRPADAARAVAALDYLAGQMNSSPRWTGVSPLTKMELVQARVETRAALGIAADAPSQVVVTNLLGAGDALAAGNPHAALALLQGPAFIRPPEQILAGLTTLPSLRTANIATMHAASEVPGPSGNGIWTR